MITASEARCRTENKQAIKEFEKIIENAVTLAIDQGDYQVSVLAPEGLTLKGLDVVTKELEGLGYKISVYTNNGIDKGIILMWQEEKEEKGMIEVSRAECCANCELCKTDYAGAVEDDSEQVRLVAIGTPVCVLGMEVYGAKYARLLEDTTKELCEMFTEREIADEQTATEKGVKKTIWDES